MSLHSFERKPPPMFRRSLSPSARMGLVAVLAIVLMLVDGRWQVGDGVRAGMATVLRPFQWLSAQPVKAVDLMGAYVTTVETAQQTKEQATVQIAQLALKAQRAELLMRENAALRELLGLQQQLPMQARAAEVAYVAADPFVRKVTLNKGSAQGIAQGAPVIDGYGLLGQVVRVFPLSSEVLLVDNPQQAVPALNNRTGERSLVYGDSQNPRGNALEIRFLSNADDVQVGDVIVTSGVGGIYPAGLPLGTVAVVERRNNSAFLRVQLTPAAHMLSVDHVLVLDPVPQEPMLENEQAEQGSAAKLGRSRARVGRAQRLWLGRCGSLIRCSQCGSYRGACAHSGCARCICLRHQQRRCRRRQTMMLGREEQRLLLPVDIRFLWGSLLVALLLNLLPLGRITWMPDFLLLVLAFWCLHQPRHVGVLIAAAFGLFMDVHRGTLLGMHALVYAAVAYVVYLLHRRLPLFRPHWQALQLLGIFVAAHALLWLLRLASGGQWPGPGLWWAPVIETLLWPVLDWVLLAPQRRAPDRDLTRPL